MEPRHEFGKEAKEMEMARIVRKRRNIRRTITVMSLVLAAILIFSFRNKIEGVFGSAGTDKEEKSKHKQENAIVSKGVNIVKRWDMPKELLEISGLSWIDKERFGCVEDEKGIVFIYNTTNNSIEKQVPFAGPGDYEGLAFVGETAWVLRSDGNLFEIKPLSSEKPSVREYKTPLTAAHNTEGLCYDKKNNRLLVAIKEDEPGTSDYKGIYSFDLTTLTMNEKPVLKIDLKHGEFAGLSSSKKKAKPGDVMMPSGIAIHPVSGDIYITEGRKPKLLVTTSTAEIKKLYQLDSKEFVQPEGITFSPEGELYISNEGTKQPGNILKINLTE